MPIYIANVIDHLMDCNDLPDCVEVTRVFRGWRPGQVYHLDRAARAYRSECARWVVMPCVVRRGLGDFFQAVVSPTVHQTELALSEAP